MKMPRHHKPEPHVPFIALADIAWQIIIFFLVASSFTRNDSLNVDLPSGSRTPGGQTEANITVQAAQSTLMIDNRQVDLRELESELTSRLTGKTSEQAKVVVVQLSDDVTYQRNAEILYAIQKAGGNVVFSDEEGGKK